VSIPIKNADDIDGMRNACRAAREILEEVSLAVVPGVSTGEVDRLAARLIGDRGGRSPFLHHRGFPGNICISVNDEIVHGIGGSRRVQYGDIVKLDIGIILRGWIGDTATTIAVGDIPSATARLLEKTQEALAIGIEQARAGNRVHHISEAIENFVVANGYSVVREFVGHGVGRQLHEEPHVPNYGRWLDRRHRRWQALRPLRAHRPHHRRRTGNPHVPARDRIEARGTIVEAIRDGAYRVELPNGHRCVARAKKEAPPLAEGTTVQVSFHPYDMSKGHIH